MGGKERNASELRKVHYNLSPCCSRFQGNLKFIHFTSKLCKVGTEIERKALYTSDLLYCVSNLLFLTSSFPSPSWFLKVPTFHWRTNCLV